MGSMMAGGRRCIPRQRIMWEHYVRIMMRANSGVLVSPATSVRMPR